MSCPIGLYFDKESKSCKCLPETFWNGYQCITCYHPKYFDLKTLECKNCPKNQIYDLSLKNCTDCPSEVPIFDGSKCVACPEFSYYDKNSK